MLTHTHTHIYIYTISLRVNGKQYKIFRQ